MEITHEQDYKWAVLVSQLDNNSTFTEQQVSSICYAISNQRIDASKKISILETILSFNPKQS